MAEGCFTTQVVSGNGIFDEAAVQQFSNSANFPASGLSYAVIAVIGPQGSGKSTLLNHLFGTNFRELDESDFGIQTTKGIWVAKAVGIEPFTLVLDLEGSDSGQRGEDDKAFEKQSALFALAMADVILVNMWYNDIGRGIASGKPLLRTVFQVMTTCMLKANKTTLFYVIRDNDKRTPSEDMKTRLRQDTRKIWDEIPKHQKYKDTPLSEVFNVEVIGLSNLNGKEEEVKEQVTKLRQRFRGSISPGSLAYHGLWAKLPAERFFSSAQQIWEKIKQNKDLDLPSHVITLATVRCGEIAREKLEGLASDQEWSDLKQEIDVAAGAVAGFGRRTNTILNKYFSEYDGETEFYDEGVREEKRQRLVLEAIELVSPIYKKRLSGLRSNCLGSFKNALEIHLLGGEGFTASLGSCRQSCILEFDQGAEDVAIRQAKLDIIISSVRGKLVRDIEVHASLVRREKLEGLVHKHQNDLFNALGEAVRGVFEKIAPPAEIWASIREVRTSKRDAAGSTFSDAVKVAGFELDQETLDQKLQGLMEYAQNSLHKILREQAAKVSAHMIERFVCALMPASTTTNEDSIENKVNRARQKCLLYLSTMAVIGLDEETDNVKDVLSSALLSEVTVTGDLLASETWDEVPVEKTLITPIQCKTIWKQFIERTDEVIAMARAKLNEDSKEEEEKKGNPKKKSSLWAIVGLLLGGVRLVLQLTRDPSAFAYIVAEFLWDEVEEAANKTGEFIRRQMAKFDNFRDRLESRVTEY